MMVGSETVWRQDSGGGVKARLGMVEAGVVVMATSANEGLAPRSARGL